MRSTLITTSFVIPRQESGLNIEAVKQIHRVAVAHTIYFADNTEFYWLNLSSLYVTAISFTFGYNLRPTVSLIINLSSLAFLDHWML